MHGGDKVPEIVQLPLISVIVSFRNGERCVLDCLRSIFNMRYPPDRLEVIPVDDWRDDELADNITNQFPQAKLIRNITPQGCDRSKQIGIEAASGDIIAFTDADCIVNTEWAYAIGKNLAAGIDAITGPVRHPKTFLRELIGASDFQDFQADTRHTTCNFPGCNVAVSREALESVKRRYDRSGDIRGGSDRLLSWHLHALGKEIIYDPLMKIDHYPAVDAMSLLQRRMMYGRVAIGVRRLDPTLPGAAILRLGPLAASAYIGYKLVKDIYQLTSMARHRHISASHIPILLPALTLFRIADALGILTKPRDRNPNPVQETPPKHRQISRG